MRERYVTFLGIRVTKEMHSAFLNKSARIMKEKRVDRSEILRELIQAFIEDRITIAPRTHKEII